MSRYIFETKMEVRDYECDIEGIVNNANYLHYMEHTRHLFLKELFQMAHRAYERDEFPACIQSIVGNRS
jgi:acyl-CoA thioester hydrolase